MPIAISKYAPQIHTLGVSLIQLALAPTIEGLSMPSALLRTDGALGNELTEGNATSALGDEQH